MKCEKCNKDIPETLNYCPSCKIKEESQNINQSFKSNIDPEKKDN